MRPSKSSCGQASRGRSAWHFGPTTKCSRIANDVGHGQLLQELRFSNSNHFKSGHMFSHSCRFVTWEEVWLVFFCGSQRSQRYHYESTTIVKWNESKACTTPSSLSSEFVMKPRHDWVKVSVSGSTYAQFSRTDRIPCRRQTPPSPPPSLLPWSLRHLERRRLQLEPHHHHRHLRRGRRRAFLSQQQ